MRQLLLFNAFLFTKPRIGSRRGSSCRRNGDRISSWNKRISGVLPMGLFISDVGVRELAERLALAQHTTVDGAVRQALAEDRAERDRSIRESLAQLDAMPHYDFDEDDMYDEIGAPK